VSLLELGWMQPDPFPPCPPQSHRQ
jgi:hypothetical protein